MDTKEAHKEENAQKEMKSIRLQCRFELGIVDWTCKISRQMIDLLHYLFFYPLSLSLPLPSLTLFHFFSLSNCPSLSICLAVCLRESEFLEERE